MLKSILFVGIGSFAGGVLRYNIVSDEKCIIVPNIPTGNFDCKPHWMFSHRNNIRNIQSLQMIQSGNILGFVNYTLTGIILGIILVWLGYIIAK